MLVDGLTAGQSGLTHPPRLPRTRALWGSPICTEIAPCGGRKRTRGQIALDLDGAASSETFERTRATALDIIAAVDVHRYDVVFCENVIEFATDWELFDWWLSGMNILDYNHQIVCASSAHLGGGDNVLAPQLRDRLYVVFTRKGIPLPDLEVRPEAICPECGLVKARQVWRNPRRRKIGKWGVHYDYRCPNRACGHLILEPIARPVGEIIEWDIEGQRIGDGRPDNGKPYAASTRARVQAGLEKFGPDPFIAMFRRNGTAATEPVIPRRPGSRRRRREYVLPELARLRNRALVTMAFAIAGRDEEVAALDAEHIVLVPEGLEVHVPSVKDRPPRDTEVSYGRHLDSCPVRCWLAWKEAAGITTGPAFRSVDQWGHLGTRRLSPDACRLVITRAAERADLETRLTGHSMRAGFITTGRKAGKRPEQLRRQSGHSAGSPVFWDYIRRGEGWEDPASKDIDL